MSLDGNFKKGKITELKPEISQKRKNIETYIIMRYGMNPSFAQQIASVLEKTKLINGDIHSGMYDSVIELTIQQMSQQRFSPLNDTRHIREDEKKANLYSQSPLNAQSQTSQQYNIHPTEDEIRKFEGQNEKYAQMLQELQKRRDDLITKLESRRGRR